MAKEIQKGIVRIRFWDKSFKVIQPVITPSTLFCGKTITEHDEDTIFDFISDLVLDSIAFGEGQAKNQIRKAIGLSAP